MDIRPPAYRQHHPSLDSFRVWPENQSYGCSLPTSPSSINFLERAVACSPPFGVLGWRFGTLPPHFTHRNISSPKFRATIALRLCAQAFHLRTCRTVVIAVTFHEVDHTPNAQTSSDCNNKGLQDIYRRSKKCHRLYLSLQLCSAFLIF